MKLSYKIFLGICIPALISCIAVSVFLIERNVQVSIENEDNLIVRNMEKLEPRAQFAIHNNTKLIVNENSYKDRNVKVYLFKNGEAVYKTDDSLLEYAKSVIDAKNNSYSVRQTNIDGKDLCVGSTKVDDTSELIFIEDIGFIYKTRNDLIRNCIIIFSIMAIGIAVIAYIIARALTKPLNKIEKEMVKVSKGNFNINLKEGRDEIGKLARSFNTMSKELDQRNSELVNLVNSKQMFIDNLAHEMNTPLTSIQGYAELLQRANLDEERKNKYLSYIESESKRILDMYKKLLLLSYKKNSDLERKDVDINKVFDEVSKTLEDRLNEKNIKLSVYNQLSTIYGDETLIAMSVTNLVKNAIVVSKENDTIIIEAFERDNCKYIHVIDNGIGISKENIEKITEPFYRVDKVRSRKNGGAGLGLSICKSIAEIHGGKLKIESTLGKGSIFILEFPDN